MVILKSIFFKNADYEDPFHVLWCGGEKEIIYGYVETSESDNEFAKCQGGYNEGEQWLCCPVCQLWYHEDCFL